MKNFRLATGFYYKAEAIDEPFAVPEQAEGSSTDLASVPSLLWGLVAPYGHQLLPALLHDYRCEVAKKASTTHEKRAIRVEGDTLFREALADRGVPWSRRWLMWAAVTLDGYRAHDLPAFVVTVLALVAGLGTLAMGCLRFGGGARATALLLPAILGLAERRHLGAAALGTYGLPLAFMAGVATLVASSVIWFVPSGARWLLQSYVSWQTLGMVPPPGRPPQFGPTALRSAAREELGDAVR